MCAEPKWWLTKLSASSGTGDEYMVTVIYLHRYNLHIYVSIYDGCAKKVMSTTTTMREVFPFKDGCDSLCRLRKTG